jgi:hypothetical protein
MVPANLPASNAGFHGEARINRRRKKAANKFPRQKLLVIFLPNERLALLMIPEPHQEPNFQFVFRPTR